MMSIRFSFIVVIFVIATLKPAIAQDVIYLDSLVLLSQETRDNRQKISLLLEVASGYEYTDPNKSLKFASNAYDIAKTLKDEGSLVTALIALGKAHLLLNNFDKALKFGEEARQIADLLDNLKQKAIAGNLIAVVYAELGEYDNSSSYYFENLKIYEYLKDDKEIGVTYGNIGADFLSLGNYSKAFEYTRRSLEIAKSENDLVGIAQQLNNLGAIYLEGFEDYFKAKQYFRKANGFARQIGDSYILGNTNLNIGLAFSSEKIPDSAFHYYQVAKNFFKEIGHTGKVAECFILIGNIHLDLGNIDSSWMYAKQALEISDSIELHKIKRDAANLLQTLSLKIADTASAFYYNQIVSQAKDSLFIKQSQNDLYKAELRYNHEKLKKELYIRQMKYYYIFGFVILALISVLLIVLLIYSNQRIKTKNALLEKEKAETELNIKNRELAINIMSLIKKNELLTSISGQLFKLQREIKGDESKKIISDYIRDLDNRLDDKMLNEFSVRFQEVHAGFYEKLLELFPDLTQNELKLCAYLRLNMSTKEISELTGQQIASIDQARYRLRKKLGISNSDINLIAFLSRL